MSAPCCGSRRDTEAMLKSLRVEAAEAGGGNVAKQMQQNEADCLRRQHTHTHKKKKKKKEREREKKNPERRLEARTLDATAKGAPRLAASPAEKSPVLAPDLMGQSL